MKKSISIGLLVLLALAFVALFWRGCGSRSHPLPPSPAVTIDTTETFQPDTGWHVPELPEAVPPTGGNFQAEADHYRHRYEHYKAEALRRAAELAGLQSLLDSLGTDCPEATALAQELAMWREQYGADSAYIAELSALATLRNYAGTDSTAEWVHRYDITVLGELPAGGYRYQTDFKQRTIERTVSVPTDRWRRRSLAGLYGRGWDGRSIYAAEGRHSLFKGRVQLIGLAGWDGEALGMVGVGWGW